ncbi:FadR/GntR family transcriptional regulator [Pseudomonas chlororaphis]|uniref:FadR/GntR family transcriptional regulator n=1 Tax=Pseudomonas chlororaphis TaxID=587753 RepID=UPI0006A63087|nr:FCD domain-containing protein [Pseudomonas chlororaphis]AZD03099.1 Transcriptional regulator, GntR family [Pseudomonas chlororaphis subsp. chlororaphis]MBM0282766.1 FadR family transcriptional regulator [Pseudomonas chlororaphis]MDO1506600.1 FadR family transcriptional regulator [Pseudomonas chlororaphis]ORM45862.1 GntR family transcriptional regulator [Pseudomonas chlororaphis subsp. chlororaphis]TWR91751.1 FadR family transcriptional regulator [Pseudomonas chlororaphis subsp. chlororaphis
MLKRPVRRKRQKLSDVIVESVKRSIVINALRPGDRLPTERELMESFQCSKGSAREALKALEVEGLVNTRTGPSGGAYLNQAGTEPASRALRNYLHFQQMDGEQVYQLRKVIEVELAVSVIGRLGADDFAALQANIDFCSAPEDSEAGQREQRIAELEFHNLLGRACPNPLLSFMAQFLNDLLRDLVVLKKAYKPKRKQFDAANLDYHKRLLLAFKAEDETAVRQLMHEHMCDAEHHMSALEGEVTQHFLLEFDHHH